MAHLVVLTVWPYSLHCMVVQVLERAGVAGFQIRAMDAAVCALWALCRHWQDPKAAVIAAVRGVSLGRAHSAIFDFCA